MELIWFCYSLWHGNELFRLLVADSPHKLQEEAQQGDRWSYFVLCHAASLSGYNLPLQFHVLSSHELYMYFLKSDESSPTY